MRSLADQLLAIELRSALEARWSNNDWTGLWVFDLFNFKFKALAGVEFHWNEERLYPYLRYIYATRRALGKAALACF